MRRRVCAELTDLTFLNGGFSYLSFTLYCGADGGCISRSADWLEGGDASSFSSLYGKAVSESGWRMLDDS